MRGNNVCSFLFVRLRRGPPIRAGIFRIEKNLEQKRRPPELIALLQWGIRYSWKLPDLASAFQTGEFNLARVR